MEVCCEFCSAPTNKFTYMEYSTKFLQNLKINSKKHCRNINMQLENSQSMHCNHQTIRLLLIAKVVISDMRVKTVLVRLNDTGNEGIVINIQSLCTDLWFQSLHNAFRNFSSTFTNSLLDSNIAFVNLNFKQSLRITFWTLIDSVKAS